YLRQYRCPTRPRGFLHRPRFRRIASTTGHFTRRRTRPTMGHTTIPGPTPVLSPPAQSLACSQGGYRGPSVLTTASRQHRISLSITPPSTNAAPPCIQTRVVPSAEATSELNAKGS